MTDRTHHHDVARPILDRAKEAEDDYNYVEEVGEDRGPLVAQEVKDLSFQSQNLKRQETKKRKRQMLSGVFWRQNGSILL